MIDPLRRHEKKRDTLSLHFLPTYVSPELLRIVCVRTKFRGYRKTRLLVRAVRVIAVWGNEGKQVLYGSMKMARKLSAVR